MPKPTLGKANKGGALVLRERCTPRYSLRSASPLVRIWCLVCRWRELVMSHFVHLCFLVCHLRQFIIRRLVHIYKSDLFTAVRSRINQTSAERYLRNLQLRWIALHYPPWQRQWHRQRHRH